MTQIVHYTKQDELRLRLVSTLTVKEGFQSLYFQMVLDLKSEKMMWPWGDVIVRRDGVVVKKTDAVVVRG